MLIIVGVSLASSGEDTNPSDVLCMEQANASVRSLFLLEVCLDSPCNVWLFWNLVGLHTISAFTPQPLAHLAVSVTSLIMNIVSDSFVATRVLVLSE